MVNLSKLNPASRITEVDSVSDRIITEYDKKDWSADAHFTGILGKLKPASLNLTKAINRIKAESNLEEKDDARDSKLRAVNYLVLGFMHHPDTSVSSAAQSIGKLIDHYGIDIINENYAAESSLIESLLNDLAEANIQTAITAIPGLSQLISELRAAQTAFEQAQVLFEKDKARLGNEANASEVKKEVVSIINDELIVYLRAMAQVDEAKYGEFARTVAQVVNDMNVTVKKRKKGTEQNNPGPEAVNSPAPAAV